MDILSLELQSGLKRCSNQKLVSDAFWEVILKSVTGTLSGNCEDSSKLVTAITQQCSPDNVSEIREDVLDERLYIVNYVSSTEAIIFSIILSCNWNIILPPYHFSYSMHNILKRWLDLSTFHTKEDISKQCFASILSLMVESARHNLDEVALSSILLNHNFSINRLQNVFDCYISHKPKLQKLLYRVSFELPILSDVHWKLSYRVDPPDPQLNEECWKFQASCSSQGEDRVLFFIQIDVQHFSMRLFEKTAPRELTFVCTVQKLQEMVWKLKESCKHIDNLINSLK